MTETVAESSTPQARPSLKQSVVAATAIMSVVLFVGTTALMWTINGDVVSSAAIGFFSAFWGGPGFGVIAGGGAHALSLERQAEREDLGTPARISV